MTEEHERPNPDELLARIRVEEEQQVRGKLKIFLGYAAGVGKTYAMLEAAHQRQEQGIYPVVAYVETHGRAETEALVRDLEVIQRRQVEYRGTVLPEMDVDAVLSRRPQLALVDELAHTNAPGSRHPKRYLDVDELLAAGIDVYTTLNVQHLESLNDVIAQITGITVRETIPDRIIDEATEIELIDLPPNELLQRLAEGKVYVPEQAARAVQKFFRKGNLTALREISMRRAAERVDDQMRDYMETRAIPGPWPAKECLLVCISSNPLGERMIRTARRLADELDAEWSALYVETPELARLPQSRRDRVARMLRLTEELGGKAISLPGHSVPETVLGYAHKHNVTKIIVGKSLRPRWYEVLRGSVIDQLVRESGPIDVYIISSTQEARVSLDTSAWKPHRPWRRYAASLALVTLGTLLSELVRRYITPANLVMIYLLTVVVAAVYLGRGPAMLVAITSVLAFDFFFVPPRLTFAVADTQYLLTFVGLLVVGLVISSLTARVREQVEEVQRREAEKTALYSLSRDLAVAAGLPEILDTIAAHISQTFGRQVTILLPDPDAPSSLQVQTRTPANGLGEHEMAVATWTFAHGEPAGRGTDTLSAARARYLPLKTARGIVGVMGIEPPEPDAYLTPDQRRLIDAFASISALAIERAQLAQAAQQAEVLAATEKLQTALLDSISHDLRTPLASVTGALTSLEDCEGCMDESSRRNLIQTAREEADRLNRLVGNLLDMTRLEAGALKLRQDVYDVNDVIGTTLGQLEGRLGRRLVKIDIPPDLPLVPMDFVLIGRTLANILDNAVKYSPPDSPIEITVRKTDSQVEISIADRGTGIPPEDLERVFTKFYRVRRPGNVSGTGLGLSISKGIVEAHGGRIWAENRPEGGMRMTLSLPLAPAEPQPEKTA